jgi:hypothetical protein
MLVSQELTKHTGEVSTASLFVELRLAAAPDTFIRVRFRGIRIVVCPR